MSFSKNPQAYPASLLELFEKSMMVVDPFIIRCKNRKEAKYIQMRLHAVKYAINHTKTHPLYNNPTVAGKQIIIDDDFNVIVQDVQDSREAKFFNSIIDRVTEENKEAIASSELQPRQVELSTINETPEEDKLITKHELAKQEPKQKTESNNTVFIPPDYD